jgi:hypothetical protein
MYRAPNGGRTFIRAFCGELNRAVLLAALVCDHRCTVAGTGDQLSPCECDHSPPGPLQAEVAGSAAR